METEQRLNPFQNAGNDQFFTTCLAKSIHNKANTFPDEEQPVQSHTNITQNHHT